MISNKEKNTIVVIPAYNEGKKIKNTVLQVKEYLKYVIVIDDGSTDNTVIEAESAGAIVFKQKKNMGKGAAIKRGVFEAMKQMPEYILFMDGDGQHSPADIPVFLALTPNATLYIGNRMSKNKNMPLVRKVTNIVMSSIISRWCKKTIPDTQCGYRMLHKDCFHNVLECVSNNFDLETEMLVRISRKHRILNVPVETIYGDETSKIKPIRDTLRFIRLSRLVKRLP